MGKYAYKAMDQQGNELFGVLEVDSEAAALEELNNRGLFPTQVRHAVITDEWRVQWTEEKDRKRKQDEEKQRKARERHGRQRLVIRYLNGTTKYGVCFALNPRESSFYLDLFDANGVTAGKTEQIRFRDLKAVFYVKSFDGKFDKTIRYKEWTPEGRDVVVKFHDGETMRGRALHELNPDDERFFIIPTDEKSNNISALIERSAVANVYTVEEFEQARAAEREAKKKEDGGGAPNQEETMGDFYFETRNYTAALEQYQQSLKKNPSTRLRRKIMAAEYNIGVQHIKRREYDQALKYMEKILKLDPENRHAKKKALKLRKIIERGTGAGSDPDE